MIDLLIMDDGKVVLNRNIKKGEIITYQNSYLKRVNQTDTVEILEDLNKEDILYAGALFNGRVVASKNENMADYLVIKRQVL